VICIRRLLRFRWWTTGCAHEARLPSTQHLVGNASFCDYRWRRTSGWCLVALRGRQQDPQPLGRNDLQLQPLELTSGLADLQQVARTLLADLHGNCDLSDLVTFARKLVCPPQACIAGACTVNQPAGAASLAGCRSGPAVATTPQRESRCDSAVGCDRHATQLQVARLRRGRNGIRNTLAVRGTHELARDLACVRGSLPHASAARSAPCCSTSHW
jgi:hypothetical protein